MPSTPVASASPETDARASTTWRLQQPSAYLVLWRKPRNSSSVAACALDPGVDATAAARPELHHGSSPSTVDARVPAIQRPNARSHRTVDNSLITGRIEYSTFLRASNVSSIVTSVCQKSSSTNKNFLPFNSFISSFCRTPRFRTLLHPLPDAASNISEVTTSTVKF